MGWVSREGFYISSVLLNASWSKELEEIQLYYPGDLTENTSKQNEILSRGSYENYRSVSFKSNDGSTTSSLVPEEKGELPCDYQWTSAYYDYPILRKTIDWFECEKTRVRLWRQLPNKSIELHCDWDNERHNFSSDIHIVRAWVQLTNTQSWYKLTNGTSEANVCLKQGQIIFLDVDTILHGTVNKDVLPRDNLIIHLVENNWLKEFSYRHKKVGPEVVSF